jgi:hypothetical protein
MWTGRRCCVPGEVEEVEPSPVAMALAREVCGLGQREIGGDFGVGPHAVSKAIARSAALRRERGKVGRAL